MYFFKIQYFIHNYYNKKNKIDSKQILNVIDSYAFF